MIPWRMRFAGVVGVGLSVAGVAAGQSSPARVSLHWSAPDECPDDAQLVHEIEALLGETLSAMDTPSSLTVRANAQGNRDDGYAAKISFTSPQGSEDRFLEHPSCARLVNAIALVIALTIDPDRVHATEIARDAEKSPSPSPSPATVPPPIAVEQSVRTRRREAPVVAPVRQPLRGLRLALQGLVGAGSLPSTGVGFQGAFGWHRERFRAEVLGRYWVPRRAPVSGVPAELELGLATLGARGCLLPLRGPWQLAACGGADLGDLRGDGIGVINEHTRHARYSDVAADVQVGYVRSGLALEAGLEFSGGLERPAFGISEDGRGTSVFRPRAWSLNVFFGVAFEL
jgi:hypothetical protein